MFLISSYLEYCNSSSPVISEEELQKEIHHSNAIIDILNEKIFGVPEWKRAFGVNTNACKDSIYEIFKFLKAPDVLNKNLRNYQTHEPPIYSPQFIATTSCHEEKKFPKSEVDFESIPYNLQTLLTLTKVQQLETFIFETVVPTITEPPGWLIVRKDLLFRGMSAEEQIQAMKKLNQETSVGYQNLPSALQIATVSLIHHVIHNKCFFGNKGIANPVSLCKKLTLKKKYHFLHGMFLKNAHVGCFCSAKKCHEVWGGLDFDTLQAKHNRHGVMAIKKIIAKPSLVDDQDDQGWIIVKNSREIDNQLCR